MPVVPPRSPFAPGAVTAKDIWDELRSNGATAVQAAGIMGNWIAESSLNPEISAQDSNGRMSYGLAQWNEASYPNAAQLVTGNPGKDLVTQVKFFFQTGGGRAATGSTPAQVASNVAANYERCSTCQSGGASNTARQANAGQVAGWAAAGNWPTNAQSAADTATLGSAAQAQSSATCAWQLPSIDLFVTSVGGGCILSKTQVRALLGTGILVGGSLILIAGLAVLVVASGLKSGPAGKLASTALKVARR